jgi:curli biogenesis system outer membrane secretion channel CsgG
MRFLLAIITIVLVSTQASAAGPSLSCCSNLDVIKFKDSGFEMTGDVISESEQRVVMTPENGGRVELRRELIDRIEYDVRPSRRLSTDELVSDFVRCVSRLIGSEKVFRLVRVTPEAVYLNLGAEEGASPGIELSVYREGEEIVDPETGASLGKEKSFVGVIQIITVEKEYAKAVPVDAPAQRFEEGDVGIYMRQSPVLAVAGVTTLEGEESPYGALLSEKLIGKFRENPGLNVVERKQLGKVLRELAIQNALLSPPLPDASLGGVKKRQMTLEPLDLEAEESEPYLDHSLAEKMRMIEGADAIVLGTVAKMNGRGAVNLRVVDTSTAAILFSTYKVVGNPERPIEVGEADEEDEEDEERAPDDRQESTEAKPARSDPSEKNDLLDRILRAIYQR